MSHTIVPLRRAGKMVFAIVFHEDALERIANHDPGVVQGEYLLQAIHQAPLPLELVDFLVCYETSTTEFLSAIQGKTDQEILKYLGRNWKNRPGEGGAPIPMPRNRPIKEQE